MKKNMKYYLARAMTDFVSPRDLELFKLRFGLNNEDDDLKTLDFIGKKYGFTRERARQISERVIKRFVANAQMAKEKNLKNNPRLQFIEYAESRVKEFKEKYDRDFVYLFEAKDFLREEFGVPHSIYFNVLRKFTDTLDLEVRTDEYEIRHDPSLTNEKMKEIIFEFVKQFDRKYGRESISRILNGSKRVTGNKYNTEAIQSDFFGRLRLRSCLHIIFCIDEMIDDGVFYVKKGQFGLPLLSVIPPKSEKELYKKNLRRIKDKIGKIYESVPQRPLQHLKTRYNKMPK